MSKNQQKNRIKPSKTSRFFYVTYIIQSTLPTTFDVQNLSFLVSQISIFLTFFFIGPIYMIFMGDKEISMDFLDPHQKNCKNKAKFDFW